MRRRNNQQADFGVLDYGDHEFDYDVGVLDYGDHEFDYDVGVLDYGDHEFDHIKRMVVVVVRVMDM